jgi:hypothetical protein
MWPGSGSASERLVIAEGSITERQVVHCPLTGSRSPTRPNQHIVRMPYVGPPLWPVEMCATATLTVHSQKRISKATLTLSQALSTGLFGHTRPGFCL